MELCGIVAETDGVSLSWDISQIAGVLAPPDAVDATIAELKAFAAAMPAVPTPPRGTDGGPPAHPAPPAPVNTLNALDTLGLCAFLAHRLEREAADESATAHGHSTPAQRTEADATVAGGGGGKGGGAEFTPEELAKHDGTAATLHISVRRVVYDMSAAGQFYGPGAGYSVFAGHDATKNLALMSLEAVDLDQPDYPCADEEERTTLDGWVAKFQSKYPVVGTLLSSNAGPGGGGDGGFFGSAAAACVATLVNTISDAIVTVTMATVVGPAAKRDSTPAPTAVTSPLDPAGLLMTFFASGRLLSPDAIATADPRATTLLALLAPLTAAYDGATTQATTQAITQTTTQTTTQAAGADTAHTAGNSTGGNSTGGSGRGTGDGLGGGSTGGWQVVGAHPASATMPTMPTGAHFSPPNAATAATAATTTSRSAEPSAVITAFGRFDAYDFNLDGAFQQGVAQLVTAQGVGSADDLDNITQVMAFYYKKCIDPAFDLASYVRWKAQGSYAVAPVVTPVVPSLHPVVTPVVPSLYPMVVPSLYPMVPSLYPMVAPGHSPTVTPAVPIAALPILTSNVAEARDGPEDAVKLTFQEVIELVAAGKEVPGARTVDVEVQEDAIPSLSELDLPKKPWESA